MAKSRGPSTCNRAPTAMQVISTAATA